MNLPSYKKNSLFQSMTKCPLPRPQFICIYDYTIVNMQEGDSSFLQQANCSRFLLLLLCDIKEKKPKSPSLHYFKAKEEKEFHQTESICWPCFNRTFLGCFSEQQGWSLCKREETKFSQIFFSIRNHSSNSQFVKVQLSTVLIVCIQTKFAQCKLECI